jgi:ribosomal protein S18 acetylase RimI-like enzyme
MERTPVTEAATIGNLQYKHINAIEQLLARLEVSPDVGMAVSRSCQQLARWYGAIVCANLVPNPWQHSYSFLVAEVDDRLAGVARVSPFNRGGTTWQVEWVVVDPSIGNPTALATRNDIGSQLLRHCFEGIVAANTWVLEVDVNDCQSLALYRHNGFQPIAQLTGWEISPTELERLAVRVPHLPNLLPVRNADAQSIYQLDNVAMPPLLRQVFDRQVQDYKTGVSRQVRDRYRQWGERVQSQAYYVFEPQRKAAIGYYRLTSACHNGGDDSLATPHIATLVVHPAYTWLYPELMAQMARHCREIDPNRSLCLRSADYQPEREEHLQRLGAIRSEHRLLMSRSVWHKLREAKSFSLEGLQLPDVLQGLQPARQPSVSRWELNRQWVARGDRSPTD